MSNPSEVILLRDELARVIAEVKKRDRVLEQQGVQIEQLRIQNEQLKGQLDRESGRITYYENPYSPSSANSIPARQRKSLFESLKQGGSGGRDVFYRLFRTQTNVNHA